MSPSTFTYVTYIATTPEKLWDALTNGDLTERYFFGSRIQSDWKEGSEVTYSRGGEITDFGKVLVYDPANVLSFTWSYVADTTPREEPSRVTFEIKKMNETVRLTLKHEGLLETDYNENSDTFEGFNNGWPAVISNLKSFLETGKALPPIVV